MRVLAIVLCIVATPSWAQVYKCSEGGKTVFSDYPCQRTDNKTIDVRPAAGGPVNRSSEYWEQRRLIEEEKRAKEEAEERRVRTEIAKARDAATEEKVKQISALAPRSDAACNASAQEHSDFSRMDDVIVRFDGIRKVASSTPKIALSGPLMRMSDLSVDLGKIRFSTPCLTVMRLNAELYIHTTITFFQRFSAYGVEDNEAISDMATYMRNYSRGRSIYLSSRPAR